MRTCFLATLALVFATTATFAAATATYHVEYMTGHEGLKAFKGQLSISDDAVVLTHNKDVKLHIPIATIKEAKASVEQHTGITSFQWHGIKNDDVLTITTDSSDGAEAIVLKAQRNEAPAIVAKIDYARNVKQ
jgi:hypothetical protein